MDPRTPVGEEDLTDWERLQVSFMSRVLRHGYCILDTADVEVVIDYRDR